MKTEKEIKWEMEELQKEIDETVEHLNVIANAIKTVKGCNINWLKDNWKSGSVLGFTNSGNDYDIGTWSMFKLSISVDSHPKCTKKALTIALQEKYNMLNEYVSISEKQYSVLEDNYYELN